MPRNGSGSYTAPANSFNPAVSSTTISASDWNSTLDDLEAALTASIAKDGQTTPTANLPMGGFKHTGVADTALRTDYAKASQVQDGTFTYLTSPSGTNTITATGPISLAAYAAGQRFTFKAAGTNTGATTININSIGAKTIQKLQAALVAGDITANDMVDIEYDGTQFQMVSPARTAVYATFSDSLFAIADNSDATKKVAFEASGITTATTRTLTVQDVSGTVYVSGGTDVPVADGGTGVSSLTAYAPVFGGTTATGAVQSGTVGTAGQVLTSNGAGALPTFQANPFSQSLLHVQDQKAANTAGGTFTSGAWRTRDLNTAVTNEISGASLGSNQITLPTGTYFIQATVPAYQVNRHKAKLRNVTDGSDVLIGTSSFSDQAGTSPRPDVTFSLVKGRFTIASQKTFEIQHQCATTFASQGYGIESNFGVIEIYTDVEIWKVA